MTDDGDASTSLLSTPLIIFYIALSIVSFWLQAKVTEDRFVPALNVIAKHHSIPDDIAGATLMAAGASSPELFSSFTALFITKSNLGLGTIVGSEMFNQLVITAGAILSTNACTTPGDDGGLLLDPITVLREVFFYALSIVLLYAALRDTRLDEEDMERHIFVSFHEACWVFAGYIAYVMVCANMDSIVSFFSSRNRRQSNPALQDLPAPGYGSTSTTNSNDRVAHVSMQYVENDTDKRSLFLRESQFEHEPVGNFRRLELRRTPSGDKHIRVVFDDDSDENENDRDRSSFGSLLPSKFLPSRLSTRLNNLEVAKAMGRFSDGRSLRTVQFIAQEDKPSDERDLLEMEHNPITGELSCFIWQRSYFYDKARFAIRGWHLRWFSFTIHTISSIPDRAFAERHRTTYPTFRSIHVDEDRLMIRINHPLPDHRNFYLLVPSRAIFDAVLEKMNAFMELHADDEVIEDSTHNHTDTSFEEQANESLVEYHNDSTLGLLFFLLLYPLRLLLHWTIPDVRLLDPYGNPTPTLVRAYAAAGSCLIWLIIGSYALVSSLEHLADWLDIPTAVVGVTVSAAGTSLPNYVASKIAAEKGFGSMAVSNAFGSNSFNIMVGLGLPWMLYTSFGTGFQPYHRLRDEGITESVLLLGLTLLVFVVVVLHSGFVLYRWHAYLFLILYAMYIAYEVARVYVGNSQ